MGYDIWCRAYLVFKFKFASILDEINSSNYMSICEFLDMCDVQYAKKKMAEIIKEYYQKNTEDTLLKFIAFHSKKKNMLTVLNISFSYKIQIGEIWNHECKNFGSKYTPVLRGGIKTPFEHDYVDFPKKYNITKYTMNIKMVLCSD